MAEIQRLTLAEHGEQMLALLTNAGLRLEPDLEYIAGAVENDRVLAMGGIAGDVIKCVAADPEYAGSGLAAAVIGELYARIRERGADNAFVFTKPENQALFCSLGFFKVGCGEGAMLLESRKNGISGWLDGLPKLTGGADAVVMNANPFTLGHLSLVERAAEHAERCGRGLYIFVVREDASAIPFDVRLRLVRAGCAGIAGATVLDSGRYMISRATFPDYFIKDELKSARAYATLDADIFASRIAAALDIGARCVGDEPFDPVTAEYNACLEQAMLREGRELIVLPRLQREGAPISASRARRLWLGGDIEGCRALVPAATHEFLRSTEGEQLRKGLQNRVI